MKLLFSAFLLVLTLSLSAQELKKDPADGCPIWEMNDGDTTWIMKQYFMVIYMAGENRDHDSATAAQIQAGHLAHIGKMGDDGYLSIAGPFGDYTDMRGILIFNVPDLEQVHELMAGDPAVQAGRLTYQVHPWWGAKGSKLN
jgi:uncharacterized protein YciI